MSIHLQFEVHIFFLINHLPLIYLEHQLFFLNGDELIYYLCFQFSMIKGHL